MQTAICCIAKCENDYLIEWVEYHLNLGFSHIYIYDNNDIDGEIIEDVLEEYVGKSVFIIDCRGKRAYQTPAYTEFYRLYGDKYDWIAYIDVDEFITFSEKSQYNNINNYLETIKDFQIVHLNWMCYGDNDIVEYASNKVVNRFVKPLDFNKHIQYDFPENNHVKSIIRGNIDLSGVLIVAHSPSGNFKICDGEGIERAENSYFKPYSFETIYIRHYVTKTIYEWLFKISKGNAVANHFSELYSIDRFFKYNEVTSEKNKVIKQFETLKKSLNSSYKTENDILKRELEIERQENIQLRKNLLNIEKSKSYKIGKSIIKLFTFFKKKQ
jgi:hypothetical protein